MRQLKLFQWAAGLTMAIALAPAAASAQEDGTVTISGLFSMDYMSGDATWTGTSPISSRLTTTGTNTPGRSRSTAQPSRTIRMARDYATQIDATSFDLEFFGPDAATLNRLVSDHLARGDVNVSLQNTYDDNGGGFAIMHVWVSGGAPACTAARTSTRATTWDPIRSSRPTRTATPSWGRNRSRSSPITPSWATSRCSRDRRLHRVAGGPRDVFKSTSG